MFDALKRKIQETAENLEKAFNEVKVSDDVRNERFEICKSCDKLNLDFCKVCGCFMPVKTYMSNQSCPIKKW